MLTVRFLGVKFAHVDLLGVMLYVAFDIFVKIYPPLLPVVTRLPHCGVMLVRINSIFTPALGVPLLRLTVPDMFFPPVTAHLSSTAVAAVALLFAVLPSFSVAPTLTVCESAPTEFAVTVRIQVALPPFEMVPKEQNGRLPLVTTFVAALGPEFLTVMV